MCYGLRTIMIMGKEKAENISKTFYETDCIKSCTNRNLSYFRNL